MVIQTYLSIKWNSIRLGGAAHGIVTKTTQNCVRALHYLQSDSVGGIIVFNCLLHFIHALLLLYGLLALWLAFCLYGTVNC